MSPSAPVVLRCGSVIARITSVGMLDAAAIATARAGMAISQPQQASHSLGEAFAAHETAMRDVSSGLGMRLVGAAASLLTRRGYPKLAKRLRAGARARDASAHPDERLSYDIAQALALEDGHAQASGCGVGPLDWWVVTAARDGLMEDGAKLLGAGQIGAAPFSTVGEKSQCDWEDELRALAASLGATLPRHVGQA